MNTPTPRPTPEPDSIIAERLGDLRYYINNPSAWESFDQRLSDVIQSATKDIGAGIAAIQQQRDELQSSIQDPSHPNCKMLLKERDEAREAHRRQQASYLALYEAVLGDGCDTSDVKDVSEIAARHRIQRDELAEVARPFVALLQSHNKNKRDDQPVFGINQAVITVGHLKAAAKAIANLKTPLDTHSAP